VSGLGFRSSFSNKKESRLLVAVNVNALSGTSEQGRRWERDEKVHRFYTRAFSFLFLVCVLQKCQSCVRIFGRDVYRLLPWYRWYSLCQKNIKLLEICHCDGILKRVFLKM
jgi:hypothetical protein